MAFTNTRNTPTSFGGLKIVTGVYTSDGGSTGGDIETSLVTVDSIFLQPKGSAILANQPVVNETLPKAGGAVTIVTTANEIGTFTALGQ